MTTVVATDEMTMNIASHHAALELTTIPECTTRTKEIRQTTTTETIATHTTTEDPAMNIATEDATMTTVGQVVVVIHGPGAQSKMLESLPIL